MLSGYVGPVSGVLMSAGGSLVKMVRPAWVEWANDPLAARFCSGVEVLGGHMRVQLSLDEDADSSEIVKLYWWLRKTDSVTSAGEVTLASTGSSGAMSAADVITVASNSVTALSALVAALAAWRSNRSASRAVSITINNSGPVLLGRDPEDLLRQLERLAGGGAEGADHTMPPAAPHGIPGPIGGGDAGVSG